MFSNYNFILRERKKGDVVTRVETRENRWFSGDYKQHPPPPISTTNRLNLVSFIAKEDLMIQVAKRR
ncbi:hypothetical protein Hanom_Chr12g01098271 [Helianthus anomalus]